MAVQITFGIDGEKQVSQYLGVVADGIKDWRRPLGLIGSELLKSFQLNYTSRGQLFGGWSPRKKDYLWPLLEKTGALRKGFYSNIQGQDAIVLTNVKMEDYGKYHQRGTRRLPQRLIMKIDNERRNFITKSFQLHIVEVLRG